MNKKIDYSLKYGFDQMDFDKVTEMLKAYFGALELRKMK